MICSPNQRRFDDTWETVIRQSGVTLWRQIEETLRAEIEQKLVRPGERLPTEAELAVRFGVNRHTVRRAMTALEERGLIRVEQGRGSFVHERVLDYALGTRTRFTENLLGQQRMPGRRQLRSGEGPATGAVAQNLRLRQGTLVYSMEFVGIADGQPISVSTNYFPKNRFPDFPAVYAEAGSITATLARFGIADYRRQLTRITAAMPSLEVAQHLQQPRHRPIVQTESINVDERRRPIEYSVTRFASDRVQLVVDTVATEIDAGAASGGDGRD